MEEKILSSEDKLKLVVEKSIKLLTEHLRDKVPETGDFQKFFCGLTIYGTKNKCRIFIEPWLAGGPEYRTLHIGAFREGTDMLVSNYIKIGTNAELLDYLAQENTAEEWYANIVKLSESVDDEW